MKFLVFNGVVSALLMYLLLWKEETNPLVRMMATKPESAVMTTEPPLQRLEESAEPTEPVVGETEPVQQTAPPLPVLVDVDISPRRTTAIDTDRWHKQLVPPAPEAKPAPQLTAIFEEMERFYQERTKR